MYSWLGKIPEDVLRDLPEIAPMLSYFGYDPRNHKPTYGNPDQLVLNKVRRKDISKQKKSLLLVQNFINAFNSVGAIIIFHCLRNWDGALKKAVLD